MKTLRAIFTLLLLASTLRADTPAAFKEAAGLYDLGRFDEAIARYESLRAAGVVSANLYFNLGNACFKNGNIGRAIINYERARQLTPRDPDIRGNLRFALNESRANENVAATGGSAWLEAARDYLTMGEWTLFATVCYWLAALGGIVLLWLPAVRRWLRAPVIALAALTLIGGAGMAAKATSENGPPAAVVVAKEVQARFAPVEDSLRHFTSYAGQKVWIVGERGSGIVGFGGWLEVERADGKKGWVPANTVERM